MVSDMDTWACSKEQLSNNWRHWRRETGPNPMSPDGAEGLVCWCQPFLRNLDNPTGLPGSELPGYFQVIPYGITEGVRREPRGNSLCR